MERMAEAHLLNPDHSGRNRMIGITAGAITVIAIVLGFAGDVLGLPWRWMRPAAELLLLAELVGLVVLERHQLFEPVHNGVSDLQTRMTELHTALGSVAEQIGASGQVTVCPSTPDVFRALTRITREALARDHEGPQILRIAALSGLVFSQDNREATAEFRDYVEVLFSFLRGPNSSPDSRAQHWSARMLIQIATIEGFESNMRIFSAGVERKPINVEVKMLPRVKVESGLSPQTITDRDAILVFDDENTAFRWGFLFRGVQHVSLLTRWFDDLWASIPDSRIVYSRNGANEKALNRIRMEIEAEKTTELPQIA